MSQHPDPPLKRRGRPPSQDAAQRALKAAHDILMTDGFGRLTIDAVAARSGVGKPTIYRNWANAQELAMAALIMRTQPEVKTKGLSERQALIVQMRDLVAAFATTRGRQITMTLAAADPESEFTKAFRNRVILSSRATGREILEAACLRGAINRPDDFETLLDMIYGPLFFRLLVGHRPLDVDFAEAIVATVFAALSP